MFVVFLCIYLYMTCSHSLSCHFQWCLDSELFCTNRWKCNKLNPQMHKSRSVTVVPEESISPSGCFTSQVVGGWERQNFSVILKTPPPPHAWGFWMPSKSRGSIVHSDLLRRQRSTSYLSVLLSFTTGTIFGALLCFAILLYGSACAEGSSCGTLWYVAESISANLSPTLGCYRVAHATWRFHWYLGRRWLPCASAICLYHAFPDIVAWFYQRMCSRFDDSPRKIYPYAPSTSWSLKGVQYAAS